MYLINKIGYTVKGYKKSDIFILPHSTLLFAVPITGGAIFYYYWLNKNCDNFKNSQKIW